MSNQTSFKVLGLDIDYPFVPYGVQKAMMGLLGRTLMNKQHSLLESPTGTGKTLVLLCSSLAWQRKSKAIKKPYISPSLKKQITEERRALLKKKACTCGRRPSRSELDELNEAKGKSKGDKKGQDLYKGIPSQCDDDNVCDYNDDEVSAYKKMKFQEEEATTAIQTSPYFKKETTDKQQADEPDCITLDDDDDPVIIIEDDIETKPAKKTIETKMVDSATNNDENHLDDSNKPPMCRSCAAIRAEEEFSEVFGEESMDGEDFVSAKIKTKIPRIYYGTRTHKQITQVIRELNKTSYKKDLRMCILSARERTCINDEVKDLASRNDRCQELMRNKQTGSSNDRSKNKGDTCEFYFDSNSVAATFDFINEEYKNQAWDIEDANKFGRMNRCCPYYGVRSLQEEADITFCPYNYLLDPTIRKTLNINLSNSIVIFDEAHNIEDICRDSAGFEIDTKQIDDILETIRIASSNYVQGSVIMDAYQFFRDKFLCLKGYLVKFEFQSHNADSNYYLEEIVVPMDEMMSRLKEIGLGPDCLSKVKENLKAIRGDDEESDKSSKKNDDSQQPALSFAQLKFIIQLAITLEFMYSSNNKNINDFRVVFTKSLGNHYDSSSGANPALAISNNHQGRRGHQNNKHNDGEIYVWKFSLLCMNSGITFGKICDLAWSIVVASGTLSPIESLKSELGCEFKNVFEGSHVISSERVFASILSSGPQGIDLNGSFASSLRLEFQDEVGRIVRDVCKNVPNGVLCFFPSYDRMRKFYERWFSKGLINEMQKSGKKLFQEQKSKSAVEFEKDLASYNRHAKLKGAILFAVFRGKVSEGIDFADKAARAVITIGIPYPNIKEINIGLKREYNDIARVQRPHLMPGGDWYASQAFRALNQALGRCIRHKEDWGAIIMIDSRLKSKTSLNSISKWLRGVLDIQTNDYSRINEWLKEFVEKRNSEGKDYSESTG